MAAPCHALVSQVDCTSSLLPEETITRLVTFTPPTDGTHRQTLECKSLVGRTFKVPIVAVGVKPSLRLSSNFIVTSATMVNDTTSSSLILTNTTKVRITFPGDPYTLLLPFHVYSFRV